MARRRNKAGLYIGIIAVVIILAVSIFFFVQQSAFSGTSTLSLSQVDLQSTNDFFSGKAWVYTFTQHGMAQKAIGIVDSEDIASNYDGDELPQYDFELDAVYNSQDCVYNINQVSDQAVYTYTLSDGVYRLGEAMCEGSHPSCGSGSEEIWILYTGALVGNNCYTLCGTKRTGAVGVFSSPDINTNYTIVVKAKGQSYSKNFNTLLGEEKGFVGDNVYAIWQGNLDSGRQCKDKDPYKPIYVGGSWRIVNEQSYQDYRSAAIALENTDSKSISLIKTSIEQVNSYANKALASTSFADVFIEKTDLINAQVLVSPQSPLQYPVITAYIKASWIGIYTPVGKPVIKSVSSDCFMASSDGNIKVVVSNEGSERDVFNVYADCNGLFTSADKVSVGLDAGANKTLYIRISADTDSRNTDKCVVYAEGTINTASKEVGVCVDPQVTCKADTLACADGNVVKCSSDGVKYELSKACDDGCKISSKGIPYCSEDETPGGDDTGVCYLGGINIFGKNFGGVQVPTWFCKYGIGLPEVFGFVIGLIVWLGVVVAFSLVEKKSKISPAVIWILGFFAGALIFLAFWLLFWVGIIVTIVVIIISNLIKRFVGKKKGK